MTTAARHCPHCGMEIPSTMAFCRSCWLQVPREMRIAINRHWRTVIEPVHRPGYEEVATHALALHQQAIARAARYLRERV